jgi:hypothetical protein
MCQLCSDESMYKAYMAHLDEMEREGKLVDPDTAMDEILKRLEKSAQDAWNRNPWEQDKTLSTHTPFVCTPIDK